MEADKSDLRRGRGPHLLWFGQSASFSGLSPSLSALPCPIFMRTTSLTLVFSLGKKPFSFFYHCLLFLSFSFKKKLMAFFFNCFIFFVK